MTSNITTGNTITDGEEFRYWFVGDIEKWCRENKIPFNKDKFGLRKSKNTEIKWGIYKKGEQRTVWASPSDKTGMSILIRGDLVFEFRDPENKEKLKDVRLKSEGDYVIWREDIEHTWEMKEDSVILTLRWQP